ncbi:MAG: ZrgA family zinc uptake protein [Pelagimonas sp.]|uniref:ZrgA family zinc uptake protein n=1 Tax=Pelagimonas sp. TaxID=2073170 RepID=UPI003D6AEC21
MLAVSPSSVLAEGSQHAAHQHGLATLNIVQNGTIVRAELTAAGADIVGFEHQATSEASKKKVSDALELLQQSANAIVWPIEFNCSTKESKTDLVSQEPDDHEEKDGHTNEDHHDDHGDQHEEEREHSEFVALYEWECRSFDLSGDVQLPVFNAFGTLTALTVNFVGDTVQGQQKVGRNIPRFQLGRLRP